MKVCNNVLLHTFTMQVHVVIQIAIQIADGTYMLQACSTHSGADCRQRRKYIMFTVCVCTQAGNTA